MSSPLSIEALQILDAIDTKGSFAAAAYSLNKVPSAISYSIQKLEQDLGVSLFQRQGRRSVLTTAGRLLVEQGRVILIATEELAAATRQVATGWEPRLRIAVDSIIPGHIIYPLLYSLYDLQPNIEIDLIEEVLGGTWETLVHNQVDLVVGATQKPPGHKGIRSLHWKTDESVFVARPDHPICKEKQPISNEIIVKYRSVIVRDTSQHGASLSRGVLNKQNFIHVPGMAHKIQAHRHGLGVGFVPLFRVRKYLESGELLALKLEEPPPPLVLNVAWKISNRGRAIQWLWEQLQLLDLNDCLIDGDSD